MTLRAFSHVAVRVKDLRKAEHFYRQLFDLSLAWREVEKDGVWWTLPDSVDWDQAEATGAELGLSMLFRNELRLAIERADSVSKQGQLSHIGIEATPEELPAISSRARTSNCQIVTDRDTALVFDDPFGVRWEVNSFSYDDPVSLSTGARLGRWLRVSD
jgi:catechol 2,3-dioxygenase-like lactoylglutathione lyase family enzyme